MRVVFMESYCSFLPESPHWLIQKGNYNGIEQYIKTANKWNNTEINIDSCRRIGPPPKEKRENCGAIMRDLQMLKLLFINVYLVFEVVMAFYYFGLSFLSVDLSDDRFTAYMLSAFVELPGEYLTEQKET
ncbi:hypothetical protein COOONC_12460 [Cooperia oncophora]